jgi:hypothetical protein
MLHICTVQMMLKYVCARFTEGILQTVQQYRVQKVKKKKNEVLSSNSCTCAHKHALTHASTHPHTNTHMHMHMYILPTHTFIPLNTNMHTYTHMYARMHARTHTHTYTRHHPITNTDLPLIVNTPGCLNHVYYRFPCPPGLQELAQYPIFLLSILKIYVCTPVAWEAIQLWEGIKIS